MVIIIYYLFIYSYHHLFVHHLFILIIIYLFITYLLLSSFIYSSYDSFEEDAEQKCEEYLNKAIELDSSNPEVYQLLASVRLSQQRNDDAKIALEKSLDLWINLDPGLNLIFVTGALT